MITLSLRNDYTLCITGQNESRSLTLELDLDQEVFNEYRSDSETDVDQKYDMDRIIEVLDELNTFSSSIKLSIIRANILMISTVLNYGIKYELELSLYNKTFSIYITNKNVIHLADFDQKQINLSLYNINKGE